MFSGEARPLDCFEHKGHEYICLDVLPVFFENSVQVLLGFAVLAILQAHRSHDQVQVLI